jgi:hypothetical protein
VAGREEPFLVLTIERLDHDEIALHLAEQVGPR